MDVIVFCAGHTLYHECTCINKIHVHTHSTCTYSNVVSCSLDDHCCWLRNLIFM